MRWRGGRQSTNVEDRRSGGPVMVSGGIGLLVIVVLALVFGVDPRPLLDQAGQMPGAAAPAVDDERTAELKDFVSVVLADTEDVWHDLFRRMGRQYEEPRLVLFNGRVDSACGMASAAVGPFYCPADNKVYLDFSFFDEMQRRLGGGGDFAQAYVIAHEIGHHVQNLMGISEQVQRQRGRISERDYNDLSVRLELQADFFAGVWAHHAQRMRNILEQGDIEQAMRTAAAIGDDRLQKQSQGYVVPDSFTHGTSEQRQRWFAKGLRSGDVSQGDTFAAREL